MRVLGRSAYPQLESWGVECIRGDVRDAEAVHSAVSGMDAVFHVAARVGYWGPHEEYRSTNVDGTQNVIDACRSAGVTRLVYTSTPSVVIGDGSLPPGADESLPYPRRYLSSYGPTKAEAERRVLGAHGGALKTVALRPHFIFGPQDPQVIARVLKGARQGRLAQVGDGRNQVDVTYIDNCVDAHIQAHDELASQGLCGGRAYFLGQSEPVNLWEFVGRVLEGFGAPPVTRSLPFWLAFRLGHALEGVYRFRSDEPPLTRMAAVALGTTHAFDHSAAIRDFGYEARVSTEEGLRRVFAAGDPPGSR